VEDEQFIVRTSERVDFTRCRQRWQWAYQDMLRPIHNAPALRFGDLIHQGLASYYKPGVKRGPHPAKAFVDAFDIQIDEGREEFKMREVSAENETKWNDARALGIEMLNNYVDHYGKDERYKIVHPEMPFQIDLYDDDDNYVCTYVGQLDAVVKDLNHGTYGLFEHKTAAAISTVHLPMDEQAGTYWALAPFVLEHMGILKPGEDLDFILYNFLRKAGKDQRPTNAAGQSLNKDGTVSKIQPAPLFHREFVYRAPYERGMLMRRIQDQVAVMKRVANGDEPAFKTILNGCTGMLSCQYRDMCELHETGAQWQELRDATMTTWDPYAAHEITQTGQEIIT
jgi:hypothetical protein